LALSKGCCRPLEVMVTYQLDHSRYFSVPPYPFLSAFHPKWARLFPLVQCNRKSTVPYIRLKPYTNLYVSVTCAKNIIIL